MNAINNIEQLNSIFSIMPCASREIDLGNGAKAVISGIPVPEYIKIVRRFKHLQDVYLAPVEFARENAGKEFSQEDAERGIGVRIATAFLGDIAATDLDDDPQAREAKEAKEAARTAALNAADTAILAAGLGYPGNAEKEAIIANWPDTIRDHLLDQIEEMTSGGDAAIFFDVVMRALLPRHFRKAINKAS